MRYRLEDGSVVRSLVPYGQKESLHAHVVEEIPERRDRLAAFPFWNIVGLWLITIAASAFVVGRWLGYGWVGAANGAGAALIAFPFVAYAGAYFAPAFADDDAERTGMFRVLVPWALLLMAVIALVASEYPGAWQ